VTKDFFVTSKFPRNILEEDKAFVSVNSFGKALNEGDEVNYQVFFDSIGSEVGKLNFSGKSFAEKNASIPQLTEGKYGVRVRGEAKGESDGIYLPIEVIKSRVKQEYSANYIVSEGEILSDLITEAYLAKEPVTIVISDEGKGKYFYTLSGYCYGSGSNRLEKKISSFKSDTILKNKFDYDKCFVTAKSLTDFQGSDGGLSQVNWGGSHLDTSLWVTFVSPEKFDIKGLTDYFEGKFADSQGGVLQKIKTAWALSLLGKSKLRELKALIPRVSSFDDKVHLGLALATLGDTEEARNLYLNILADYAYTRSPYIRIDANQNRGSKPEDFIVDTSKTLLLGELVDKKYNSGLYEYVADFRGNLENYLIDLSEIAYLEREIEALPEGDTTYALTTSSGVNTETINKGRSMTYELTESDINLFTFKLDSGKAEILAKYYIGIDGLNTKVSDDRLSIKRSIEKAKPDGSPIQPGDIIKVSLELTLNMDSAPKGSYKVYDYLPSGLSYLENPTAFGLTSDYYPFSRVGQSLIFHTYNSPYVFRGGKKTITYFARASAVGSYTAEPAVFQSLKDLTVLSKTGQLQIIVE